MKFLKVRGNVVANWTGEQVLDVTINDCACQDEFERWRTAWMEDKVAVRYDGTIYVKLPLRLDEFGEFYLDYDVLTVDEANARINLWNERYKRWLVV